MRDYVLLHEITRSRARSCLSPFLAGLPRSRRGTLSEPAQTETGEMVFIGPVRD
jgi:hypothetical protein